MPQRLDRVQILDQIQTRFLNNNLNHRFMRFGTPEARNQYTRQTGFMSNNESHVFIILPTSPQFLSNIRLYNRITNRYLFQVIQLPENWDSIDSGQLKFWQIGQMVVNQLTEFLNSDLSHNFSTLETLPIWHYNIDLSGNLYTSQTLRLIGTLSQYQISNSYFDYLRENILDLREWILPVSQYFEQRNINNPIISDTSRGIRWQQTNSRPIRQGENDILQHAISPLEREYLERINHGSSE
jgi:hypothetical protein